MEPPAGNENEPIGVNVEGKRLRVAYVRTDGLR